MARSFADSSSLRFFGASIRKLQVITGSSIHHGMALTYNAVLLFLFDTMSKNKTTFSGWIVIFILSSSLAWGLAVLAMRPSVSIITLEDVIRKPHFYNEQEVEILGYVGTSFSALKQSNDSFSFIAGRHTLPVKNGFIPVPPQRSLVKINGIFRTQRSQPYVTQHIELTKISTPPALSWFDELDFRSRHWFANTP
jgi:hypothetical protein